MLQVVPASWLAWSFAMEDAIGKPVGTIRLSFWRDRASILFQGQHYRVARHGILGPLILEGPGGEIARAVKASPFSQGFLIDAEGKRYELRKLSLLRREYGLFLDEIQMGSVVPQGWFSHRAAVDIPDDSPASLKVFVVWLALRSWRRNAAAVLASMPH